MANDLQIKRRIDVVKNRMLEILRHLASETERGVIKSAAELQHRVYHELQKFYESIGTPSFKQIEAWGPPYSEDHNLMMSQILTDLHTLYGEIENMTGDIQSNFEQVELERQSFLKRIAEVESLVGNLKTKVKQDYDVLVFQDDFVSVDNYDKTASQGTPAYLSTSESLLTLNRIQGESFNEYAMITVIDGNGVPGNTHVVRSVGDQLKFEGEEELHINLASILDENGDTWFEYEIFEVPQQTQMITQGKDFRYREAVDWVKNDIRSLRCVIQITLSKEKNMNWISFAPYVPFERGAMSSTIEKVVVSDEKGNMKGMGFEEGFDSSKAFIFPRQKCKTITIYLRQDTPYPTTVGHFYYKQIDKENVSMLDSEHIHDGVRVHGTPPSIEDLGVSYDSGTKEIVYPIVKYGDTIENEMEKKQNLFVPKPIASTGEEVLTGIEQVYAFRYMIGMRDAKFANYRFSSASEYVSVPYISSTPIKEITLDADYDIPESFGDGEWVRFFISVDDGQRWHEIHTEDVFKSGIKKRYVINSNLPKDGRLEENGYIETIEDVHEVRLRIQLTRPVDIEESEFYTPVVYRYELNALA